MFSKHAIHCEHLCVLAASARSSCGQRCLGGGAGVDEGQARVNRCVVIVPCPRRHPQPDAVLLESHRGFLSRPVSVSARGGPQDCGSGRCARRKYQRQWWRPRLGSAAAWPSVVDGCTLGNTTSSSFLAAASRFTTAPHPAVCASKPRAPGASFLEGCGTLHAHG
jgi:hypothetical protein